jgi:hypothetical protein
MLLKRLLSKISLHQRRTIMLIGSLVTALVVFAPESTSKPRSVRSWSGKAEAERVAWSAPGVAEVESHIVISP